jgi:hypothetical protein
LTAAMIAAPGAGANVTLGSRLAPAPGAPVQTCACTLLQTALPGAHLASPVSGTIVRWRVNMSGGGLLAGIRVVKPIGPSRTFLGAPNLVPVATGGVTVPASLPISAGDRVALDISGTVNGNATTAGAADDRWVPAPGAGTAPAPTASDTDEVYFNADVEPTNTFTLGSAVADTKKGTTSIDATLPNIGSIQVSSTTVRHAAAGKKKPKPPVIDPFTASSVGPGPVTLKLEAGKRAAKLLSQRGKLSATVTFTYTPDFGATSTQSVQTYLKKKKKKKTARKR